MAPLRRDLLRNLAFLGLLSACGAADPSSTLLALSEGVVMDLIDEVDLVGIGEEDRRNVVHLLARDPRESVRSRLVRTLPDLSAWMREASCDLLGELAADPSAAVRKAVSLAQATEFERADPLERLVLAVEWGREGDPRRREVFAEALALAAPCRLPGLDLLVEDLAGDPSPLVRAASLRAAGRQLLGDRAACLRLARRLAEDPEPGVRREAGRFEERLARA